MLCAGGVLGKDSCQVSTLQSFRNCSEKCAKCCTTWAGNFCVVYL